MLYSLEVGVQVADGDSAVLTEYLALGWQKESVRSGLSSGLGGWDGVLCSGSVTRGSGLHSICRSPLTVTGTHILSPGGTRASVVWVKRDFRLCQELRFVGLLDILDYKGCSLSDNGSNSGGRFRFGRGGVLFFHNVVIHKPLVDRSRRDKLYSKGGYFVEELRTETGFVENHNMRDSRTEEGFHRDSSCLASGFQSGEVVEVEVVVSEHV